MICDNINLPSHQIIRYKFNHTTRNYTCSFAPVGFDRMPPILKIESTQYTNRIKSKLLVRGRFNSWNKKILTGLIPVRLNWYYGDQLYRKKKYLLIFQFDPYNHVLKVYYTLNQYPICKSVRVKRVERFIQTYYT